jgi:hypothetical protein
MSPIRSLALVVVALMFTAASARAQAQEMVENPAYASWAKHKPGTKVTMQMTSAMQGMTMKSDMTQTLKTVTPEKATVEMAMTMDMGGMKHENKSDQEITAKVAKGSEHMPPDFKGTYKEVGSEKVTAAGKTYDCKVYEFSSDADNVKSSGKLWSSPEMPGTMVKMEVKTEGAAAGTTSMAVTAVETK